MVQTRCDSKKLDQIAKSTEPPWIRLNRLELEPKDFHQPVKYVSQHIFVCVCALGVFFYLQFLQQNDICNLVLLMFGLFGFPELLLSGVSAHGTHLKQAVCVITGVIVVIIVVITADSGWR